MMEADQGIFPGNPPHPGAGPIFFGTTKNGVARPKTPVFSAIYTPRLTRRPCPKTERRPCPKKKPERRPCPKTMSAYTVTLGDRAENGAGTIKIVAVFDSDDVTGTVYTVGCHEKGAPDLVVYDVPRIKVESLAGLLNYASTCTLAPNETIQSNGLIMVTKAVKGAALSRHVRSCCRVTRRPR